MEIGWNLGFPFGKNSLPGKEDYLSDDPFV